MVACRALDVLTKVFLLPRAIHGTRVSIWAEPVSDPTVL